MCPNLAGVGMAGRGAAPKPNRRSRNALMRGEWIDLKPLEKPLLPDLDADVIWRKETVRTWELWRQDPVTAHWTPADLALALDTIRLHNDWKSSQMAELRQRMNELGLTPQGKRDLRWRVGGEQVADESKRQAPARKLRAV